MYTKCDVVFRKVGDNFLARGIVYLKPDYDEGGVNEHVRWKLLNQGSSEVGVMTALEDLWNRVQVVDADEEAVNGSFRPPCHIYLRWPP
jgi:hypothetical protein